MNWTVYTINVITARLVEVVKTKWNPAPNEGTAKVVHTFSCDNALVEAETYRREYQLAYDNTRRAGFASKV